MNDAPGMRGEQARRGESICTARDSHRPVMQLAGQFSGKHFNYKAGRRFDVVLAQAFAFAFVRMHILGSTVRCPERTDGVTDGT